MILSDFIALVASSLQRPITRATLVVALVAGVAACGSQGQLVPADSSAHEAQSVGPIHCCFWTPTPSPTPNNGPVGSYYDLERRNPGVPVLTSAVSHVVYVARETAWGDQVQFLSDLEGSYFFKYVLRQYVPNLGTFTVSPTVLTLNETLQNGIEVFVNNDGSVANTPVTYYDLNRVIGDTASLAGSNVGPGHIYHVILPTEYSLCQGPPNNLRCWGADKQQDDAGGEHIVSVSNGQPVYITIQQGGSVPALFPSLADAVDSALSHELFETITDPDGQNGWRSLVSYENVASPEVADLCQDPIHSLSLPLASSSHRYAIQPEWSNRDAHCYPIDDIPWIPIYTKAKS